MLIQKDRKLTYMTDRMKHRLVLSWLEYVKECWIEYQNNGHTDLKANLFVYSESKKFRLTLEIFTVGGSFVESVVVLKGKLPVWFDYDDYIENFADLEAEIEARKGLLNE